MQQFFQKFTKFIGSKVFFVFSLFIFFVSAAWIALSARFPMAFDEGYHLGIIKIYAHRYSPFFITQPPGPATFGALTRDPSYLYHYVMSFPYRIVGVWTDSPMVHIVTLRFIDIIFFAAGVVLMRAVLLKTKASRAVVNVSLLFLILTPVVPLLAGQINYDDLLIPLTTLALLLTIQFIEGFKLKHKVNIGTLVALLSVCMLTSLVKFTFLPIFAAIVVYLGFELLRFNMAHRHVLSKSFKVSWRKLNQFKKVSWQVVFLASLGLFINTYGVNIIEYHNPIPQCGQVLSVRQCANYAPWARNYADALYNTGVNANPLRFTVSWFYGMFTRLFFTINGPGQLASNANYLAPVMAITAAGVAGVGIMLFFWYGKRLLRRDVVLTFLLFVTLTYCVALWSRNYHDFLHLGQMVAINGRYLVPIIAPVYLVIALSYQQFLGGRVLAEGTLLIIVLFLFLEGGGAIGYIYYSNSSWYWPHDYFVTNVNQRLQQIIKPFFIAL